MRLKLTFVLLLLNIALFGSLYYLEKHADAERRFDQQSSLVLPPGAVEEADALEIEGPEVPQPWRIARGDTGWRIAQPLKWPANRYAVENILNQLRFLRWETRFPVDEVEESGRSLADYGLENPSVRLHIHRDGVDTLLRLGAPTQIGNRLYLLSPDGSEIMVVGRDILRTLLLELSDLRSDAVFAMPPYQVRSVAVQRESGARVRLIRRGEQWEFESPIRVAADPGAVESLLADLLSLNVGQFVPADMAQQGLLSPSARVTVEAPDARQTLLLGGQTSETGQIFATLEDSPEVFTLDGAVLQRLLNAQEDLRARNFNDFQAPALGELRIAMGERSVTLQKLETGEWQVLRQDDEGRIQTWRADPALMQKLIERLDGLMALRFVSDAPSSSDLQAFGFSEPQRRVTMKFDGQTRVLLLGDIIPDRQSVYARLESDPFVYEVGAEILQLLRPVPLHYRTRELETLPEGARITRLLLEGYPEGPALLDLRVTEGEDIAAALAGLPAEEAAAAEALLRFIREGRARDFLSSGFDAQALHLDADETLPWQWRLSAEAVLPAASRTAAPRETSYLFSERLGGTTQFGATRAMGLTFTLPQSLIDALHPFIFQRTPPELEQTTPATEEPAAAPAPEGDVTAPTPAGEAVAATEGEAATETPGPETGAPVAEPAADAASASGAAPEAATSRETAPAADALPREEPVDEPQAAEAGPISTVDEAQPAPTAPEGAAQAEQTEPAPAASPAPANVEPNGATSGNGTAQ